MGGGAPPLLRCGQFAQADCRWCKHKILIFAQKEDLNLFLAVIPEKEESSLKFARACGGGQH